jgi:hypothetical protein
MADTLRRELSGLKLSALRRRALADGVGEEALDLASDGADAKAAVVELLLAMAVDAPAAAGRAAAPAGGTAGKIHRVDPKFANRPSSLTENPYKSRRVDPNYGSTL